MGLVPLQGMGRPSHALPGFMTPCLCPVKLWFWCSNSANAFFEFQTSGGHWTPAFCSGVGSGPENLLVHLRKLAGWTYRGFEFDP